MIAEERAVSRTALAWMTLGEWGAHPSRVVVAALAIAGAEKILRREINAQAHADLLNQLKQELK